MQIINLVLSMILTIGMVFKSERSKIFILRIISFLSMVVLMAIMFRELSLLFVDSKTPDSKSSCIIEAKQFFGSRFVIRKFKEWFNLKESDTLYQKIELYFAIIISFTIFHGFKMIQKTIRFKQMKPKAVPIQIFDDNENHVDATFFFKFLIDFGYRSFGVELTLLAFFIVIFARLDIVSFFYVPFLVILCFKNRQKLQRFWLAMSIATCILILFQCLIIGFFIIFETCQTVRLIIEDYSFKLVFYTIRHLRENPWIIAYDFLLLVILSCQVSYNLLSL